MAKYCMFCGFQLPDKAQFCVKCGQKQEDTTPDIQSTQSKQSDYYHTYNQQPNYYQPQDSILNGIRDKSDALLINQISTKIKTEGIVWIVVASLQVIMSILNFILSLVANTSNIYSHNNDSWLNYFTGICLLIVAIINYAIASNSIKYSNEIKQAPTGIIEKYISVRPYIGTLIYNIIFGGIIGIIGSIFGFVTRSFVLSNEQQLIEIEEAYNKATKDIPINYEGDSSLRFCEFCGNPIPNGGEFCNSCGKTQTQKIYR